MNEPGKNTLFCGGKLYFPRTYIPPSLLLRVAFCLWMLGLGSCRNPRPQAEEKPASFLSDQDYFPDKVAIRYARGFSVRYFGHYKLLSVVNPFAKQPDTTQYVLVQRGTPRPTGFPGAQFVEVPIRTMVGESSAHIALTGFLRADSILVGLGSFDYISSPEVLKMVEGGKLAEVGSGSTMNREVVLSLQPDLLMTVGRSDQTQNANPLLSEAGIAVLSNAEWMENTPLGRAEWVKLLAVFLNKEALVNEKFGEVERRYNELARLTTGVPTRPTVFNGMSFKGVWHVAGGNGYMARFLKDAGADYYWAKDTATGSLALDFESVYAVATQAEFWVNPSSAKTRQDLLTNDSRHADFRAFKTRKVYNNNRRTNDRGSNDYWESGLVNPHLVLADLIRIFHPDLLPDHQLVYYQPIAP